MLTRQANLAGHGSHFYAKVIVVTWLQITVLPKKNQSLLKIACQSMSKHKSHPALSIAAGSVYQEDFRFSFTTSRVTAYFALAARSFHVSFVDLSVVITSPL